MKDEYGLFKRILPAFKTIIRTFLFVLIPSSIVLVVSFEFPWLADVLAVSDRTPWGIVTSLFYHLSIEHLVVNMSVLLAFFLVFLLSNIFLDVHQINSRLHFLILTIFVVAVMTNLFWLIIRPDVYAAGSSGIVFALQGVVMGFSLLNSLKLRDIRKWDPKTRKLFLPFCSLNLVLFMAIFLQVLLAPYLFLNVAPGVNVVIHAVSFYISFLAVIVFWQFIQPVLKRYNTKVL